MARTSKALVPRWTYRVGLTAYAVAIGLLFYQFDVLALAVLAGLVAALTAIVTLAGAFGR